MCSFIMIRKSLAGSLSGRVMIHPRPFDTARRPICHPGAVEGNLAVEEGRGNDQVKS